MTLNSFCCIYTILPQSLGVFPGVTLHTFTILEEKMYERQSGRTTLKSKTMRKKKKNNKTVKSSLECFVVQYLCLSGLCDFCIAHSVHFLLDVAAVCQANPLTKACHHPPHLHKQTDETPGTIAGAAAASKDKSRTSNRDEIVLFSVLLSGLFKATESSECTSKVILSKSVCHRQLLYL